MTTTVTKPSFGSASALTTTNLQSLASSSTYVAGWSSAVIDNTSNLSMDEIVSGLIKVGTSPTANTAVEVWAWEILDDSPTYPDTITGSESGSITLTSLNVKNAGAFKPAATIVLDSTSNRIYPFTFRLSAVFGGSPPKKWGLFITQASTATLNSSGNVITRTSIQYQNV